MSLIADALRKTGQPGRFDSLPPRPKWSYLVAFVGVTAVTLAVLVQKSKHHLNSEGTSGQKRVTLLTSTAGSSRPASPNLLRIAEGQWRLNGIVRGGPGQSLAIINGKLVEEGSSIQGAKLVRVSENQVDLELGDDGQVKTLKLQ